jgi:hypothetical protein
MIYKDYEIEATAEQLDDNTGGWVSIRIYAHNASHSNGKVFKLSANDLSDLPNQGNIKASF